MIKKLIVELVFQCTKRNFGLKNDVKRYKINFQNNSYQQFIKRPKTEFKDSVSLVRYTMILRNSAITKGYILASVDELSFNHKTATLNFYLGEKFEKCDLKIDEEELKFIKKHEKTIRILRVLKNLKNR